MKASDMKKPTRCLQFLCVAMSIGGALAASGAVAAVLIDDHFDNEDLATGGLNGGFQLVANVQAGTPAATEAGTLATVTPGEAFSNTGIYSLNSINPIAAGAIQATIEVASLSNDPQANGVFFGVTNDNTTFYRSQKNFGLILSGQVGDPDLPLALIANDGGADPGTTILASLDAGAYDLASLLDGFTASFSADQTGWSYEVAGVTVDSAPAVLSSSGVYPEGFTYAGQFDAEDYFIATVQRATTVQVVMKVDRMTLTAVPEPSTLCLVGLGLLGLGAVRRRR
jgi:hypothetical protein